MTIRSLFAIHPKFLPLAASVSLCANRNFKQAFGASSKVPKKSPGGNHPISDLK